MGTRGDRNARQQERRATGTQGDGNTGRGECGATGMRGDGNAGRWECRVTLPEPLRASVLMSAIRTPRNHAAAPAPSQLVSSSRGTPRARKVRGGQNTAQVLGATQGVGKGERPRTTGAHRARPTPQRGKLGLPAPSPKRQGLERLPRGEQQPGRRREGEGARLSSERLGRAGEGPLPAPAQERGWEGASRTRGQVERDAFRGENLAAG